jgi:hypothetical protein
MNETGICSAVFVGQRVGLFCKRHEPAQVHSVFWHLGSTVRIGTIPVR